MYLLAIIGSLMLIEGASEIDAARKKIITDEHSGRILVDAVLADEQKAKMEKLFSTI